MFGKLGVCLFVIISGYFYDKTSFKIKKFASLILQIFVYSIMGLGIALIMNNYKLSLEYIIKSIFPSTFGLYWFASCYIMIYMFSPLLKKLIENISKKNFKILLTLMIIIWGIFAIIPKTRTYYNDFIWLIVIYFLGAYIKKYNGNFMKSNKNRIVSVILIVALMNIIMILLELLASKVSIFPNLIYYFNSLNSPLILILTVLIFTIFKKLHIENSKLINKIASTTWGIYLIHANYFLNFIIWEDIVLVEKYINSQMLIINATLSVIGVFIVCALIDIIIEKFVIKNLIKLLSKIFNRIKQMKIYMQVQNKIIEFYNN